MLTFIGIVLTVVVLAVWWLAEGAIDLVAQVFVGFMGFVTHSGSFPRKLSISSGAAWIFTLMIWLPRAFFVGLIVGVWWLCT